MWFFPSALILENIYVSRRNLLMVQDQISCWELCCFGVEPVFDIEPAFYVVALIIFSLLVASLGYLLHTVPSPTFGLPKRGNQQNGPAKATRYQVAMVLQKEVKWLVGGTAVLLIGDIICKCIRNQSRRTKCCQRPNRKSSLVATHKKTKSSHVFRQLCRLIVVNHPFQLVL